MSRGEFLGDFEHLVMLAVSRRAGEAGGADIHEQLERVAGRDTSLPAIYVTLARLERKGYITSRTAGAASRGGRPRRLFSVTRSGAAALRQTRNALERLWSDDLVHDR